MRANNNNYWFFVFGHISAVFGRKAKFDHLYMSIESKLIDNILSSGTLKEGEFDAITKDLEFQHNFRKNKTLRAYFTKDAAKFAINFGLTRHRAHVVRSLIECVSGERLKFLELGSGSSMATAIASKYSKISHATALDYDDFSLSNIVPTVFDNLEADLSKVATKVGTFSDTGLSTASIDLIYAGGALHHCVEFREAFVEAFRILKPGGIFFISDFVPHERLSKQGRDFIFASPHGPLEYSKKFRGESFLSNRDVNEHFRSDVELLYHAQMAGFQTKHYIVSRPSNSLNVIVRNIMSVLFKKRVISKVIDFSFNNCGYDSAGNHIETGEGNSLSPAIFNLVAVVPHFLYRHMGVLAPRFDNRLYILRKPKTNETVPFINSSGNKIEDIPV